MQGWEELLQNNRKTIYFFALVAWGFFEQRDVY